MWKPQRERQWQSARWLADHPNAGAFAFFGLSMRGDVLSRTVTEFTFPDGSRLELVKERKQDQIRAYAPD